MKRILVLCVLTLCASVSPVRAQVTDDGYVQGNVGASTGKRVGALIAAEGGAALGAKVEIFAELGWMTNLQPATLATSADTIAAFLQTSTGQAATYSADSPTLFGSLGARYFFGGTTGIRPYALASVGFARIDQRVHFALAGSDVTSRLGDLGVTLGQDLDGALTKATVGAGAGVLVPFRSLQLDLGYRYTRIFTSAGTNANRIYGGVRYRF